LEVLRSVLAIIDFMASVSYCYISYLLAPVLWASIFIDCKKLHPDILANLTSDLVTSCHLGDRSDLIWTQNDNGFLHHDGRIYVPEASMSGMDLQSPTWSSNVLH
jgi:hypothetical protein